MNKKNLKLLAVLAAVLVIALLVLAIRGCGGGAEETVHTVDKQLQETTVPTTMETLDPNGSYVQAGVSDETWPDEEAFETETTTPEEETEPTETTQSTESTDPTETTTATEPTEAPAAPKTDYEVYMSKSAEEQQKFLESFPSVQDFFIWLENAKKEYEASRDYIEIGGNGPVDIGDILGKNNG